MIKISMQKMTFFSVSDTEILSSLSSDCLMVCYGHMQKVVKILYDTSNS